MNFSDLVLLIVDESESKSFESGKELYESCVKLCVQLLDQLDRSGHPWDIINNTALGDFGTVERSPAIAAYAGLMSKRGKIGDPVNVMLGSLMCDVGMLELTPDTTTFMKLNPDQVLPEEFNSEFELHPIKSLNACLSRRLPLPDKVKNVISFSHELHDGTGFPNRVKGAKIPLEAQLVQFCEELDRATLIKMGQERKPWIERASFVFNQIVETGKYSPSLFEKVRGFFQ